MALLQAAVVHIQEQLRAGPTAAFNASAGMPSEPSAFQLLSGSTASFSSASEILGISPIYRLIRFSESMCRKEFLYNPCHRLRVLRYTGCTGVKPLHCYFVPFSLDICINILDKAFKLFLSNFSDRPLQRFLCDLVRRASKKYIQPALSGCRRFPATPSGCAS